MREFLRYLFVIATVLMVAVGDVWGQTYNGGVWYSLYDLTERTKGTDTGGEIYNYTGLFTPNSGEVTFNTKMTKSLGINPKDYSLNVGGKTVSVGSAQTSYIEKSASDLDANITSLKFSYNYTIAKNLTRTVYINGVKLPLAPHILLEGGVDNKALNFENVTIGGSSNAQVVNLRSFLTHNNSSISNGNIVVSSSSDAFRIDNTTNIYGKTFDVGKNACASSNGNSGAKAGGGILGDISQYSITIYFCPSKAQEYNETITITDGSSKATITVKGTGLKKNQTISWIPDFSNDEVSLPVGKTVSDVASATSGGSISYSYTSSDGEVLTIDGTCIKAMKAGTATLTAAQAGNSEWNSVNDSKVIKVTEKKVQYIKWDDNLTRLKLGDPEFSLNAVAHVLVDAQTGETVENAERTSLITYESNNEGIVRVNGNVLTIVGEGSTTVKANLPGDDVYESTSVSMPVRVRDASSSCVDYVLDDSKERELNTIDSEEYTINGLAHELTFTANRTAILGFSDGNLKVDAYYGGSWHEIFDENVSKNNYTTYGPIRLDRNTTKLKFYTETGATGNKHIKDVAVTMDTYVEPFVDNVQLANSEVFELDETAVTAQSQKTFELNWSTCADGIYLESDDESKFIVQPQYISADAKNGKTIISVTCVDVDEPKTTIAGNINITYDGNKTYTLPVSCFVQDRFDTWIEKQGSNEYLEPDALVEDAFLLKDKNGVVMGATITLQSSNDDIISIENIDGVDKLRIHCGGDVAISATFAGSTTHKPCSLDDVNVTTTYCGREMIWTQNYLNFVTDENYHIDETRVLNATVSPVGEIVYELHTDGDTPFAEIVENDGVYYLHVFGRGTGFITATVAECEYNGQWFESAYMVKDLRVSKPGACSPNSLEISAEQYVYQYGENNRIYTLKGLPAATMTFGAHAETLSDRNNLKISFSKDLEGDSWEGEYIQTVVTGKNYNWNYSCPVLPEAKRVRFQADATLKIYYNMVTIPIQTYLRTLEDRLDIDVTVNVPFERTINVDYSNVQVVQYEVSNTNGLGLTLTTDRDVDNGCFDYGSYVFTLRGTAPYPLIDVEETIVFHTTSGESVEIPVKISASLSDEYVLIKEGNWNNINCWQVNGGVPTQLPTASNPVSVSAAVTIGDNLTAFEAVAYSVEIKEGGCLEIMPKGGLTVYAGGINGASDANLTIHNNLDGAGFVRISPLFTSKLGGTLPTAKVLFTTRGQLNGGGLSADWQYIASPGSDVGVEILGSTVLYLRSEQEGWVRLKTFWAELDAFAGYALTQKAQPNFTMYPQLINGNTTIQLTCTADGMQGDNLWGNSYMAPIDITKINDDDFTGNVDKVFYLYNSGSWNDWNDNQASSSDAADKTPGRYIAIPVGSASRLDNTKDQTVVSPMQGVYMKAKEGGGALSLNYEKHVWNNTQSNQMNLPMRVSPRIDESHIPDILRIRLQVNSKNSGADRMYVIQDSTTTAGYDNGYDAPKQMASGVMNIYTNERFGKMEISSTNNIDSMYVGFESGSDTQYTMTFTSLIGEMMYLYDTENDTLVEMQEGGCYEFEAKANTVNDWRFQILLNPDLVDTPTNDGSSSGVTTNVPTIDANNIWVSGDVVYLASAEANSILEVYTTSGMLVTKYNVGHTPCTINLSNLATGVYVLRLNDWVYKMICNKGK